MTFDRFDICDAYYLYATQYHGGQGSKEYKIHKVLHRIKYRPSMMLNDEDDLSDNAREIYNNLVSGARGIRDR